MKEQKKKLNEVFDNLGASDTERTSILHSLELGHITFKDVSEITPENVQTKIEHVAVKS
jgi:hypothetical protein